MLHLALLGLLPGAVFGFPGELVERDCNRDDCFRQVFGTRSAGQSGAGVAACSSYFVRTVSPCATTTTIITTTTSVSTIITTSTTTTTTTPAPLKMKRQQSCPGTTTPSAVPASYSSCTGTRFSSVCACAGVQTVVTTLPTPTVSVTSTSTVISTTTSTSVVIATATASPSSFSLSFVPVSGGATRFGYLGHPPFFFNQPDEVLQIGGALPTDGRTPARFVLETGTGNVRSIDAVAAGRPISYAQGGESFVAVTTPQGMQAFGTDLLLSCVRNAATQQLTCKNGQADGVFYLCGNFLTVTDNRAGNVGCAFGANVQVNVIAIPA